MIRRPPRSTLSSSSAASDVYKRQAGRRVDSRSDGTKSEPHSLTAHSQFLGSRRWNMSVLSLLSIDVKEHDDGCCSKGDVEGAGDGAQGGARGPRHQGG